MATGDPDPDDGGAGNVVPPVKDDEAVKKLIEDGIAESLKPIKEKLDGAFAQRDAALAKVAEFERKAREDELKRLQDEGKHKEAYDLQLAEERAKREALEKENVNLTRNLNVRNVLSGLPFRSENALEMAYEKITKDLIRNDKGVWVHKSGVSMKDFITAFHADEANEFLFKTKASSGSGSSTTRTAPTGEKKVESLFAIPQAEVLKLAEEGKLPQRRGR